MSITALYGCHVREHTVKGIEALLRADESVTEPERYAFLGVCRNPSRAVRYVTASEAAEILRTSKRTVWRLVRCGRLSRVKLGPRCTRFRLRDVEELPVEFQAGN